MKKNTMGTAERRVFVTVAIDPCAFVPKTCLSVTDLLFSIFSRKYYVPLRLLISPLQHPLASLRVQSIEHLSHSADAHVSSARSV